MASLLSSYIYTFRWSSREGRIILSTIWMLQLGHTIMEWDLPIHWPGQLGFAQCQAWLITSLFPHAHLVMWLLPHYSVTWSRWNLLNRHKPKYYRSLSLATVSGSFRMSAASNIATLNGIQLCFTTWNWSWFLQRAFTGHRPFRSSQWQIATRVTPIEE